MNAALPIIVITVVAALVLGLLARRGISMDIEQWSVGGRSFGPLFVFVLMAGEVFTTFTFLGGGGYAYAHGVAALYMVAYTALGFMLSYWLLPPIWRIARAQGLLTQADFFRVRYGSRPLALLVAGVGLVAMIPYLVLQLRGLGIIVQATSYGLLSPTLSVWIGAGVMCIYVVVSGMHGSAWTATVKDVMVLAVVVFLGLYMPWHYYGGMGPMFAQIARERPELLTLSATGSSPSWFCSTILISALGIYMWPHTFGSALSAHAARSFRINAVMMPLYTLVMILAMVVGFAAIDQVPGLRGGQTDMALLRLSIQTFPSWFVGLIGAAGLLTAIVPGSMMLIATATLVANNIFGTIFARHDPVSVGRTARTMVPVITLVAVWFALDDSLSIVNLLIMGYNFVTQLFPALVACLPSRRIVTTGGAATGICVGVGLVMATVLTHATMATLFPALPAWVRDINIGSLALGLNVLTMLATSQLSRLLRPASRAAG
ncbi:sodium:solute symporter [Komagataeibacter sp. FNDCF1]|uniref:sodium:solute symporter family protein n=1 Tax=Komagataeibacter sp. FNDCF1 TaxID=2878681 RepID=UPI001E5B9C69|nr:sodium:solute symporter family protein [Komagataeibacter sp. FNDCF1]MCE2563256.1 sodium:solute symporter family protein [Komagataeibacter sp. FNDCF1]